MKWEHPPLALFAAPPLTGLLAALIGFRLLPVPGFEEKFLVDVFPLLASWSCLLVMTVLWTFAIPAEWGDPNEIRMGLFAGVGLVFLPQLCGVALLMCGFWFLFVISLWAFFSTYQWKRDAPPFRTGLWLGMGGLAGMFLGGLLLG